MNKVEIYALCCPKTLDIKYIGKANDSLKRLKSHIRDSRRRNTPVYKWIKSLAAESQIPILKVLKITTIENWEQDEIAMIHKYRCLGTGLLNIADGGKMPYCDVQTRKNNVEKLNMRDRTDKDIRMHQLKLLLSFNLRFLTKIGRNDRVVQIKERLSGKGILI